MVAAGRRCLILPAPTRPTRISSLLVFRAVRGSSGLAPAGPLDQLDDDRPSRSHDCHDHDHPLITRHPDLRVVDSSRPDHGVTALPGKVQDSTLTSIRPDISCQTWLVGSPAFLTLWREPVVGSEEQKSPLRSRIGGFSLSLDSWLGDGFGVQPHTPPVCGSDHPVS